MLHINRDNNWGAPPDPTNLRTAASRSGSAGVIVRDDTLIPHVSNVGVHILLYYTVACIPRYTEGELLLSRGFQQRQASSNKSSAIHAERDRILESIAKVLVHYGMNYLELIDRGSLKMESKGRDCRIVDRKAGSTSGGLKRSLKNFHNHT